MLKLIDCLHSTPFLWVVRKIGRWSYLDVYHNSNLLFTIRDSASGKYVIHCHDHPQIEQYYRYLQMYLSLSNIKELTNV